MLNLIKIEFLKLRRRKLLWLMMSSTLFMPFFAMLYFKYVAEMGGDPMQFYKWSAFGYTFWFILPVVLGMLCTMIIYEEKQYDMLKQLWIVPVSKMGYFFSKFSVVLIYSISFMVLTAIASVIFSVIPGLIKFQWESILYMFKKCIEIGVLTSFAMMPILAIATLQKGYILPICITLVYTFFGFIIMPVNMYLHPISSVAVIIMRNKDIPGLLFTQEINIPIALLCIFIWDVIAILVANISLIKRK